MATKERKKDKQTVIIERKDWPKYYVKCDGIIRNLADVVGRISTSHIYHEKLTDRDGKFVGYFLDARVDLSIGKVTAIEVGKDKGTLQESAKKHILRRGDIVKKAKSLGLTDKNAEKLADIYPLEKVKGDHNANKTQTK